MGERQRSILGVVAAIGIAGGLLGILIGFGTIIVASGAEELGAAIGLGLGIAIAVLSGVALLPALLLRRGLAALGSAEPGTSPPGPWRRVVAGIATAGVLLCWLAPAALTVVAGIGAPGLDRTLAFVAIGLGIVAAATAWASRDLLGRPLGALMLGVAVLSVALPLGESRLLLENQNRQNAFAAQQSRFQERFGEILAGPTPDEIAAAVGDVGAWRLISVGVSPMFRAQELVDNQQRLVDLPGQAARFAIVAQCTAQYGGAQLTPYVNIYGRRDATGTPADGQDLELPLVPCDGMLHVIESASVILPDWDAGTLAGVARGDWLLVGSGGIVPAGDGSGASSFIDHGERWLVFGAAEPAPSIDPLLEAVAAQLHPIRAS